MPVADFSCCSECGRKLYATFFCPGCGHSCCSLDCYCRHEAAHAETLGPSVHVDEDTFAGRLEPAR